MLCDFHVHTRWSDGRLSVGEVVDLYGRTGKFDVIAITDHILMSRDILKRVGRIASLGLKHFSVTQDRFADYLADIRPHDDRSWPEDRMLVLPGREVTQIDCRSSKDSHINALNITEYISADQPAVDILKEIRRQGGFSIACHPHHRTPVRVEICTCFLWDNR